MSAQNKRDRISPGPELRALYTTRWWLITSITAVLVGLVTLAALPRWTELNGFEHVCLLVALPLTAIGIWQRRRPQLQWLCVAGLAMFPVAALLAPAGSPPWLPLPNSASYPIFIAIVLTSRRIGFLLALALPVVILLIWADRPTNVVAGALLIGGGWVAIVQALATSLCAWWVWNLLVRESVTADEAFAERERRTVRSQMLVERARLWREAGAQVHESVLNSIRYVLSAPYVDRLRLSQELDRELVAPDKASAQQRSALYRLMSELTDDPLVAPFVRVPQVLPECELSPEVYRAARNALIELARNSVQHGGASLVDVTVEHQGEQLSIVVTDDGLGMSVTAMPGFGTRAVLQQDLGEVGATCELATGIAGGTKAVMTVPLPESESEVSKPLSYQPFDKGRLIITSVLAGSATVGIAYQVLMALTYQDVRTSAAAIAGFIGCVSAVTLVLRRRHTTTRVGFLLILAPALVPWLLIGVNPTCLEAPWIAPVLNVAGFCVIIVAAWSGSRSGAFGVLLWASGAAWATISFPAGCREAPALALMNSLLAMPIALRVTYAGVRSYERAAMRLAETRRREIAGQTAAQTAIDLNVNLYGAVGQAVDLLTFVADGAEVDERVRAELEMADARIRAAIQVDPVSAGAFAMFAKELVQAATGRGVCVRVRALAGSDDQRALPRGAWAMLSRAIAASTSVEPIVQVFTDGSTDYLTLIVGSDAIAAAGLKAGAELEFDTASIAVISEDDSEIEGGPPVRVSVLLTRSVVTSESETDRLIGV